ncbi:acetyl-coenzyme A transporter 1 [Oratosquilla oratoria]|uniref:acetyl-coenzyme A transporter 1 n=1 Tax=Oratosquilla oratoria TaxID=337810 RepID=UPI003F76A550
MRRQAIAKEAEKEQESTEEGIEEPLLDHGPKKEVNDQASILLLLFLYVLQGIPLGLAGSIPMILQNRNISYKDQATFSFSFWPFSLKLLWAPLVDSCYSAKFGRRKSWMIPSQYLIGIFMWILSANIDNLLGKDSEHSPNVILITAIFFALNFLAATQDIAVDGWALTMLSKENLGWASTCNSVGQTAGYFLGYVVFLAFESRDFCVNFLGLEDSLVTLPGFLYFWGIIFIITTTLVGILKSEDDECEGASEEPHFGLIGTYQMLWSILGKTPIKQTVLMLLTCKIGFAAADSLTVLKLTESGVPKDRLALLSIPLTPVQVFLPLIISRYTAGPRPMDVFLGAFPIRLLFGLVFAGLVWITPMFNEGDGHFPFYYYGLVVAIYILHQIVANCMFVAIMAFFAKISDASVGGTYMTLLNTFTNLGGNWPAWMALRFVPELTWKACQGAISALKCDSAAEVQACKVDGGSCVTELDGYYVENIIFVTFGFLWLMWGRPVIKNLQSLPKTAWLVSFRKD